MSGDLQITRAMSDDDLQRLWATLISDLRSGRRGVNDPLVYEALFRLKIRRLEKRGMPPTEAEAAARENALKDIERLAAKQAETVARQRRPTPAADGPTPLPDGLDDEGQLSPGEVMQVISDCREGKASPDRVKLLLSTFCKRGVADGEIVEYLRQRCAAYLKGDYRTLDQALGLARGRGRPRADEDRRASMAIGVLRLRLTGKTFEVASEEAAETFRCKVTTVSEAWAAYWPDAINTLLAERMLFGNGDPSGALLTPEEAEHLERVERALVNTPAYSRHFAGVTKRSKRHK